MKHTTRKRVLIIGAGPSGLILGYHLQKRNIDYLILEKNDQVGSSWRQMPDHLHLISLWHSNCLLKEDLPLNSRFKTHKAKDFADYLEEFSKKHRLNIKAHTTILDINKVNDLFFVETQYEQYVSEIVVDCRGYFNFPFIPPITMKGHTPLILHFKDYKNNDQLNDYKKILIVGKRLSAGQLLCELSRTGNHELFISARSKIKYSSSPLLLNIFLKYLNIFEWCLKKLQKNLKYQVEVPMHYSAKKIVEKQTKVKGDILKIENKNVYFTCGSIEEIDAIIFATGFAPPEAILKDDFESSTVDGLFYLGRGAQRTFTSRFIRGIREDAPILGQLILGRLESKNKVQ